LSGQEKPEEKYHGSRVIRIQKSYPQALFLYTKILYPGPYLLNITLPWPYCIYNNNISEALIF
jgi:hypothetical protein